MSESYDKAKQLLEQLVYTPHSSKNGRSIQADVIPLEQRSLFERLQSFSPLTWFGKPAGLSAVACATRGWRNTGPDLLTCDSCGAKIWCKLPTHLVSDTAAGIIRGFEQQLTYAHNAACMLRNNSDSNTSQDLQQNHTASQLQFPILPSSKLSSSYDSRLQGLSLLEFTPRLVETTVPRLFAAGRQLHPTLPSALAALLQLPVDSPTDQASTAAAGAVRSVPDEALSQQQVTAILALCGWQVQPLLPPHLAKMVVSRPSTAFGVSHLVPRSGSASSSRSAAAAAGSIQHSSSIPAEDAALCCELCGCKVGLWKFSKSGPYYMAQLASKAMSVLTAAEAAFSQQQEAAAAITAPDVPALQQHQLAVSSADAGDQVQSTIAGGPLQITVPDQQLQQHEQQQQDTVASPEVVVSSLYHTIAGGSVFCAQASTGATTAALRTSPGIYSSSPAAATAAGFGRAISAGLAAGGTNPGFLAKPHATRPGPFGAPTAPAFGSSAASAGDCGLGFFGLPSPAVATARLFGEAAGPAVSGSSGPFGAAPSASPSAAPVFGLGALREEEQRTKRRRSSSDAAAGAAAAAAAARMPSFGRSMSASPGCKLPHSAAGPSPESQQPPAKQQKTEAAVGAVDGGISRGRLRSFMKQRTIPAAAAAAEKGLTGSAETFEPISQHRTWCPWVNIVKPGQNKSAATARTITTAGLGTSADASGVAAALAVGWCSTLLALQEQLEEQQLLAGEEPLQQGDNVMQGLLGEVPKPGQFGSTAAVLAKTRQMFDALEG